jgi:predicted nucleotidyltransferase
VNYGLKQRDIDYLLNAFRQYPEVEQAVIFGSRAKGSHKNGSDIDLAIKGKLVTDRTISALKTMLEDELPLPFFIDIVHYEKIKSKDLTDHIDRVGKVLYEKD